MVAIKTLLAIPLLVGLAQSANASIQCSQPRRLGSSNSNDLATLLRPGVAKVCSSATNEHPEWSSTGGFVLLKEPGAGDETCNDAFIRILTEVYFLLRPTDDLSARLTTRLCCRVVHRELDILWGSATGWPGSIQYHQCGSPGFPSQSNEFSSVSGAQRSGWWPANRLCAIASVSGEGSSCEHVSAGLNPKKAFYASITGRCA